MFELIISNGTIVDGTGKQRFQADIGIQDGKISSVDDLSGTAAVRELDAAGLVVCPGFIDIHSHSDFTLLLDPRAVSSITQGVTLEVFGNCGHGCAPITNPDLAAMNIFGFSADYDLSWRTMAEYLDRLEAEQIAVNVLSLVPNGNLRLAVAGLVDRPSTPDELKEMKKLLEQSLEEGAFGFSTGLEYGPEKDCPEEEIIELCKVTARKGGFHAAHTRNLAGEAVESIAEAIRSSAAAELPLQISHISVVARLVEDSAWAVEQALDQVEKANAEGMDVGFDMHTRLFGTTNLSAALPPWALEGDRASVARRLRDPATRREMARYPSIVSSLVRDEWRNIVIFQSQAQPDLTRRTIAELSQERGLDPLELIFDLLLAELEGARDGIHNLMIIAFNYRAEDLRRGFVHPDCMLGSDATALAPDGPLAGSSFHGAYTWASWFFRHFVRDSNTLEMEEVVRRLTSLPASRLGIKDRGIVRPGAWADLAIFNPATFRERGTTFEPNQVAEGMHHVVVNGTLTMENGNLTGAHGGHVLRRNQ